MNEKILEILENDCNLPLEQVAVLAGMSTEEAAAQIDEMRREKIILGNKSVINWEKTDKEFVTALIELKVTPQRGEGFDKIAYLFEAVGKIEKEHEERYRKLLKNIEDEVVFSKDGDAVWICRNCGHICIGKKAPEVCPVCAHPQAHFEVKKANF